MAYKILLKNSLIYGVASSLQKLIPVFTIPIITKFLDKESMKVYDVSLVYALLFSWLIILGQDSAAAAYYYDLKTENQKKHVLSYSFFIQVIALIVLLSVVFLFRNNLAYLIFSGDKLVGHYWIIALMVIPGQVFLNYSLVILRWLSKSFSYLLLCLFNTVLSITSVWILVRGMGGKIDSVFYSYIVAINLCGLIGIIMIRKEVFVNPFPVQKDLIKKLVVFGLPFAFSSFFNQLIPSIDRVFLLKFGYGASLANYSLAVKLGSFISLATSSFGLAFSPFALSIWNNENAEKEISRIFEVVSIAFLFLVPLSLIFKDALIHLFANSSYESSSKLFPFFFFGWVFDMFIYFSMLGIYKSKKASLALFILMGSTLFSCILNSILIPFLGMYGAALAFCVTKFFLFFANLHFSKKYFRVYLNGKLFFSSLIIAAFLCFLAFRLGIYLYTGLILVLVTTLSIYFWNSIQFKKVRYLFLNWLKRMTVRSN